MKIDDLKFDERGLIPAIVQDARTREVLTLAYMNEESLGRTIETGQTWFWSRSRNELWHKGATSGNTQSVLVHPAGPACHTGARSCFDSTAADEDLGLLLNSLYELIESRKRERPEGSYTTYLFNNGLDKILKKVGEESAETIIAAKNEDGARLTAEVADLVYHLLVLLVARGVSLDQVRQELANRRGASEAK
jgi:phosphoribosyl-ATP pyrophosphohydrolase/phosphoribosyl-AMP cyclohydrolase